MNCEANGCKASLELKSLPGSAMGGPSPWVVTDIPAGWCVRFVENVDIGSGRLVVLCPAHSAGVVRAEGRDADLWAEVMRQATELLVRIRVDAGVTP